MEIVQTGTNAWPWCMGMIVARFAVFVRRVRVLGTQSAHDQKNKKKLTREMFKRCDNVFLYFLI